MDLNICLVTVDLQVDHPEWNYNFTFGDRSIYKLLNLPTVKHILSTDIELHRPEDFGAWRAYLAGLPSDRQNKDRFPHMLNLLEQDARYWIYITY